MRSGALFAALLGLAVAGQAAEKPKSVVYDARVRTIDYNPLQVVELTANYGYVLEIQFAPGEDVVKFAAGDIAAWDIGPFQNHLFIKPKGDDADTNLTVLTNRRSYTFDVHAVELDAARKSDRMYLVRFRYPEDEAARVVKADSKKALNSALAGEGALPQRANRNYWVKGSEALTPSEAWDDGRFTHLRFPNNRDIPAAYIVNDDGSESLVNTHVEGDVVVVHKVVRKIILRKGNAVTCVFNRSFDSKAGVSNTTGTTVQGVERVLKGGAS